MPYAQLRVTRAIVARVDEIGGYARTAEDDMPWRQARHYAFTPTIRITCR